jgi:hypothetical protein
MTFREREQWICAVLASDLPDVAVRVAVRIAMHLNIKTGRCDPTYATLTAGTGVPRRTLYRKIELLEAAGWIEIKGTRGRHANQYTLLNPATVVQGLDAANSATQMAPLNSAKVMAPLNAPNGAKTDTSTVPNRASNSANMVAHRTEKRTEKRTEVEKDSPPSPSHDEEQANIEERVAFERFWKVYPRHVAKKAASIAFTAALKNGTSPENIIEGAKRYAAERDGQDERYTVYSARWLREERWNDQPQAGAVIDQDGNPIPQPRQQREPTLAELAMQLMPKWRDEDD